VEPASKSLASQLAYVVTKRVAAILLPLGFGLGDFIAAAKSAFVEAAAAQIEKRGSRPSAARIAVLTGLSRAEVAKVRLPNITKLQPFAEQRTERVMHGWFTDPRFVDTTGSPRSLSMTGPGSFDELVRRYSGDIPRMAVLQELIAGGMAEVSPGGAIKPVRRYYVLESDRPHVDLEALSADVDVLLRGAANSKSGDVTALRRISVQFPNGVPLAVRKTIALRTERFMEAVADYLHANSSPRRPTPREEKSDGSVFHLVITQCESNDQAQ